MARCRSHPKEAAFVHKYPPADTALHRMLRPSLSTAPLPSAMSSPPCSNSSQTNGDDCTEVDESTLESNMGWQHVSALKLAAVRALLGANKQAVFLIDSFGRTPLHLACMDCVVEGCGEGGGDAVVGVALEVLRANSKAATMTDSTEQRTPLHFLVARSAFIPTRLLTELVQSCPGAMRRRDICGDTPLDILKRRMEEVENVELVLTILQKQALMVMPKTEDRHSTKTGRSITV